MEADLLELLATNNRCDVALGWLALCSLVNDVNMQLMSQSTMISLYFQFSLVTEGFGCEVMCSLQSLHKRPGWAAWKVISYLRGGEPNLGLQLIATFHGQLPSVAYVMLCFCFAAFLCYCLRSVGEMCQDMEHIGGINTWASSITSAHKIWQSELKYPTPGLLGSSCSCKICSVLLQQLTVALNISLCQWPRDSMPQFTIQEEPVQKKAG